MIPRVPLREALSDPNLLGTAMTSVAANRCQKKSSPTRRKGTIITGE